MFDHLALFLTICSTFLTISDTSDNQDIHSELTIKSDTGQHSQFCRCFILDIKKQCARSPESCSGLNWTGCFSFARKLPEIIKATSTNTSTVFASYRNQFLASQDALEVMRVTHSLTD